MLKDTEFANASMRVRAVEGMENTSEKLNRIVDAKTVQEAYGYLFDGAVNQENTDPDEKLDSMLSQAYGMIEECAPDKDIVNAFKYPYDCQNLKFAIKSEFSDCTYAPFEFGTISGAEIKKLVLARDFERLPKNMAVMAALAIEEAKKANDPQLIDIYLDKGCLLDIRDAAISSGNGYLIDIVKTKLDIHNILSFVRAKKMGKKAEFYQSLVVDGGYVDINSISAMYGEEDFFSLFAYLEGTAYRDPSQRVLSLPPEKRNISFIEKIFLQFYFTKVAGAKYISFGSEVLIGYIVTKEKDIKNIRIAIASKKAGLSPSEIREMLI